MLQEQRLLQVQQRESLELLRRRLEPSILLLVQQPEPLLLLALLLQRPGQPLEHGAVLAPLQSTSSMSLHKTSDKSLVSTRT